MRIFDESLSLPKRSRDGAGRSHTAEETVARLRGLMPRLGITRLANLTGLDVIGIPTWTAIRPNARGLSTSQGKGVSHAAAQASALMESIEGWHAENIARPLRIESHAALAREAAVADPLQLSRYADAHFRRDLPIAWIEGFDLIAERPVWVPFETVSTNYVVSARGTADTVFVQSSNGLSGGNHLLEATAHGLAEVVERDAVAETGRAVREMDPARRIRPETVDHPECRALLESLEAADVVPVLFDLRTDLGLAVCGCAIVDRDGGARWRLLPPFTGYGCHPSPGIALSRAITEAVQSRVTYIAGSRDDIALSEYLRGGNADDLASFRDRLAGAPAQVDFASLPDRATDSFEGDIAVMLGALAEAGLDSAVAVDLRRPETGIPVVKLVVPGLAAPTPMIRGRRIVLPERPRSAARAA